MAIAVQVPLVPLFPGGVVSRGSSGRRAVALTFDADMTFYMRWLASQGRLPAADAAPVLDALARHDAPATLFLTGLWAEMYPDRVRALAANPRYELASHTYSHGAFRVPCYGLSWVPPAARTEEIVRAGAVIASAAGSAPRLLRFPGGCFSPQDQALAEALGYRVVLWDVISTDATSRSSESIANVVLGGARNGSIIVLHMTGLPSTYTARALDRIIPGLRAQGFELVTVSDLFRPLPLMPGVRARHGQAGFV
jgi:peptidoglycan/xylan/chitin deacetylase (PgdA/CDA1 family)